MTPEVLNDEEWSRLLMMANPTIDPFGEQGAALRRQVDWIIAGVFSQAQAKSGSLDETETFANYAAAGAQFIRGMRALDSAHASIAMTVSHFDAKPARTPTPLFDGELASRIEWFCEAFRRVEEVLNRSVDDEPSGPNSKPWLHAGVSFLFDLWRDELGQEKRSKKDFLDFAYAVLGPLRIGVTHNSVLESFDRHVKKTKPIRRRLRQLRTN
ncbi:hypothetical protein [Microvirga sesbaniae]|uniref:hypothetical protein n=1 Tax=Microvirga sesbaniae TaxID=681392 RepID=UPI0021CADE6F|nr:hypothetical protein [Microvirga sp. HBU67692]